jgi:site-specific DNA-adenine methylase
VPERVGSKVLPILNKSLFSSWRNKKRWVSNRNPPFFRRGRSQGGISYNRKDLARKIAYLQSPEVEQHFTNTVIENMDFEAFLQKYTPGADDFIFLDPPYDSEFSTYTQNTFDKSDQERLAHYLLNGCMAKFMLVIKNTPTIFNLYTGKGLNIQAFDKKYLVSFQDRNNRRSEHLMITNYEQEPNLTLWSELEAAVSSSSEM